MINIYLDKVVYFNIIIKNKFFKVLLKNKEKLINILNFFLILKKNLFKILNNKKLIIFKNNIKKCEII